MHKGFDFEVHDLIEHKKVVFHCPEEIYDMLVFIGAPGRYCVRAVFSRTTGEIAASSSTQRLNLMAGRYVGKDDPVCVVRCQSGLPAVGEALEPILLGLTWSPVGCAVPTTGLLMPCGLMQCNPTRFDGPPRVIALGFQICNGKLIGPQDFFQDPSYDNARSVANQLADYLRSLGPFEPHRLGLEDLEYTTMPDVMKRLSGRLLPID